ncbi:MAG: alpha-N-arabinofuranosidase [Lachnospiraceae bacterium]|nr:alpha-N-arabinofuranosidase [Lachnospiraceae bacterium]
MATLWIDLTTEIGRIHPNIYGHFAEHLGGVIYDGLWVGETSLVPHIHGFRKELVEKLRAIHPPVIRWPGGCFAETYDWRDGIGPRDKRPETVNWWYNDDGRTESNQVGTHEMVDFCRLVGAEPYFALNATSKTPLEGRNWVEYCNMPKGATTLARLREEHGSPEPFSVKYWGLGNENWGGGGAMTPEDYCEKYRTYGILCKSVYPEGRYIACGANDSIPGWTEEFFETYNRMYTENRRPPMYGYSLHYYVPNFGELGNEKSFTEDQWYETLRRARGIEPFVVQQAAMLDAKAPGNNLALIVDEWGLWHRGPGHLETGDLFEQESTMREALVAGITLNIFNNHCDRVKMANVAQLVNCIQSLFLAHGDQLVLTTTYHVFAMFQRHQGATAYESRTTGEKISYTFQGEEQKIEHMFASASGKEGSLCITLVNTSLQEDAELSLEVFGGQVGQTATVTVLRASEENRGNSFEEPEAVMPVTEEIVWREGVPTITVPRASVVQVTTEYKLSDSEY